MNARLAIFLLTTAGVTACTKVEPPPPPPTPPPTPIATPAPITPHPAAGASKRAIQLYPDLAVKGSLFNATFVELYEQQKISSPQTLAVVDWPLTIAYRTASMLGVTPKPERPPPTPTPAIIPPQLTPVPRQGTLLDQPAKSNHYRMKGTPEYRAVTQ